MARAQAEQVTGDVATEGTDKPKRKVNRGARGPQSIYLFVRTNAETGKQEVAKSFRDPRKMAAYLQGEGSSMQFLVTTPE